MNPFSSALTDTPGDLLQIDSARSTDHRSDAAAVPKGIIGPRKNVAWRYRSAVSDGSADTMGCGATTRMFLRAMDIVLSLAALAFLLPFLLIIAALIAVTDTHKVIFLHQRVGRGGVPFYCLKFRSMTIDADNVLRTLLASDPLAKAEWERDHKLRNDPRITRLGYFLRKSSLDELPQLWNVLVGDMSFVGPRPIVQAEICLYGRYFKEYCLVKPGITGLWQVSGRNDVSYRRRVAFDVKYCRHESVGMYLAIMFRTLPAILLARGVY